MMESVAVGNWGRGWADISPSRYLSGEGSETVLGGSRERKSYPIMWQNRGLVALGPGTSAKERQLAL